MPSFDGLQEQNLIKSWNLPWAGEVLTGHAKKNQISSLLWASPWLQDGTSMHQLLLAWPLTSETHTHTDEEIRSEQPQLRLTCILAGCTLGCKLVLLRFSSRHIQGFLDKKCDNLEGLAIAAMVQVADEWGRHL